jgi:hypothetical protein
MITDRRAGIAGLGIVLALVRIAAAGTPDHWEQVFATASTLDEPAVLRTADGVLHVVNNVSGGPHGGLSEHRPIAPNGSLGAESTVFEGWASIDVPALVPMPGGGMRLLFGAIHSTDSSDPLIGVCSATSDASGAVWSVDPMPITDGDGYGSPVGAVALGDGTPLVTWWNPYLRTQRGLGGGVEGDRLHTDGWNYYANLAVDGVSGAPVLGWFRLNEPDGVYAQAVDAATGVPVGAAMPAPYTTEPALAANGRLGMTGRPGFPGVFAIYEGGTSTTQVHVWRVGDPEPMTVADVQDGGYVGAVYTAIAAGPDGRLWAVWNQNDQLFVRRSNPDATAWGAPVTMPLPAGAIDVYHVAADAQADAVDVVVTLGFEDGSRSIWHTQALPGMTLATSRATVARRGCKLRVTVSDGIDTLGGATVSAGAKSRTTSAAGVAKIRAPGGPAGTTRTITATHIGFAPAAIVLPVGRPQP